MKLDQLTFEVVKPLMGTSFWAEFPNGAKVELRVAEVAKVMQGVENTQLRREPFSIYFVGPKSYMLKQGTYMLRHEHFPELLPMFLVPIGEDAQVYSYEAVFT
jgi:hypothetical protein